jgi:hypothetical protein
MQSNTQWRPAEIIVHQKVGDDPATLYFLSQCPGVPIKHVNGAEADRENG